jgi:hypothetical protein
MKYPIFSQLIEDGAEFPKSAPAPAVVNKNMTVPVDVILRDIHESKRDSDVCVIRACGEVIPVKAKSLKAFLKLCKGELALRMEITDKAVIFHHSHNGTRYTGKCTFNFYPVSQNSNWNTVTL